MTQNEQIQAGIKSIAFNFDAMLEKLKREINRLQIAQSNNEPVNSLDHALNGAFTAFHLLRWEAAQLNPSGPIDKETHILAKKQNDDLNLLHDIVTCMKHMTVDKPKSSEVEKTVKPNPANIYTYGLDAEGNDVWGRSRKIIVKFGSQRAESVLHRVYLHYNGENSNLGIFTEYLEQKS